MTITRLHLFCDESCHLPHDRAPFLLLGLTSCRCLKSIESGSYDGNTKRPEKAEAALRAASLLLLHLADELSISKAYSYDRCNRKILSQNYEPPPP